MIRYEAPDGSFTDSPTPDFLRSLLLSQPATYWHAGGNGEAVLTDTGSCAMLCVKQPPETDRFLLTFIHNATYAVPHIGGAFDDFVMDERGGDPFRVPVACLVDRATAASAVVCFVETSSMMDTVSWVQWDDLPESYHFP